MAEFYNLDEAARALGMSSEELKAKAQAREVRAFMDSGTWRFRKPDIDELARRRGMGSDPDLSLSDLDMDIPSGPFSGSGSEEMLLSEFQLGVAGPDLSPPSAEVGSGHGSDQDILLDDIKLPPDSMSGSSSTIIGMKPTGKSPSDSDVRLVPDQGGIARGASDSDVRLSQPPGALGSISTSGSDVRLVADAPEGLKPSDSDVTLVHDTGSDFDMDAPVAESSSDRSDETMIARSPFAAPDAKSAQGPPDDDSSDFELTPSSVIDALQPESGSDFELTALDASDEFDATPAPKVGPSDSDVTGAVASSSGINLGRPSDSGINLQAVGGGFDMGEADSIELAPLDEDEGTNVKGRPAPSAKPKAKPAPPVDKKADLSATALPMKSKGEKDIFEDTDFEVDALDSSEDRTVQLEAASDFDLDDSDSASEVFAIDEDDVDQNAATAMGPAMLDEDEEADDFGGAVDEAISGESASAWDVESEATPSTPVGRAASPVLASRGAEAEWGGLWVGMLGVATLFMLLLAFVGMDLVRNMYDFHEGGPASGLVKSIAGLLGMMS